MFLLPRNHARETVVAPAGKVEISLGPVFYLLIIVCFLNLGHLDFRYKEGHAIRHWQETQHCYSLELETQRVWNYVEDNYVHRLIQSKTDGKLVELNSRCIHADGSPGVCDCNADFGMSEALFGSKVEAVIT